MSASTGGLPGYAPWLMWAGDTEPLSVQMFDAAGAPVDLTGRVVRVRLTHIVGAARTTITLLSGTDPEIVIADQTQIATRGQFIVTLGAARTAAFPRNASRFAYEVALVTGANETTPLAGDVLLRGAPA